MGRVGDLLPPHSRAREPRQRHRCRTDCSARCSENAVQAKFGDSARTGASHARFSAPALSCSSNRARSCRKHLDNRPLLHNAPIGNLDDLSPKLKRLSDIMRHRQHRRSRRRKPSAQLFNQFISQGHVQPCKRLVEQQQASLPALHCGRRCSRDRNSLALAAGERRRKLFCQLLQPKSLNRLLNHLPPSLIHSSALAPKRDILPTPSGEGTTEAPCPAVRTLRSCGFKKISRVVSVITSSASRKTAKRFAPPAAARSPR